MMGKDADHPPIPDGWQTPLLVAAFHDGGDDVGVDFRELL
jgi:hypothetical protein